MCFAMRTLIAAAVLIVGLLVSGSPAGASKKKTKADDALVLEDGKRPVKRRAKSDTDDSVATKKLRKRSADDPVLRRYGKKAEYVVATDYRGEKRAKPVDGEPVAKPIKKKAKPAKVTDEEIVVIEETPAKKKPKAKPAKAAPKAAPKADDDEIVVIEETPVKKKSKAKPAKADEIIVIN
jgi:hypothetical protein